MTPDSPDLTFASKNTNFRKSVKIPIYRATTVVSCTRLKTLDGKRVTEEERRTAGSQLKREIEKRKQEERNQIRFERRKLAISNAARLWIGVDDFRFFERCL